MTPLTQAYLKIAMFVLVPMAIQLASRYKSGKQSSHLRMDIPVTRTKYGIQISTPRTENSSWLVQIRLTKHGLTTERDITPSALSEKGVNFSKTNWIAQSNPGNNA